jgi:transcription antitermination factor NusG
MAEIHSARVSGTDSSVERKWFALYTASHHEKRVQDRLLNCDVESFVPLYRAAKQWKKRRPVSVDLPLFPNYVFVHIAHEQRVSVLGTPGVFSLIGSGQQAWELPEKDIEALRSGIQSRKIEPHPFLRVGERARVKAGALAGLEGIVVRTKGSVRFVLTLDQIMQSVSIEVDGDELEPI